VKTASQAASDYARVERAIRYLAENFDRQPTLAQVSRHVALSEYHFQRLFRRWAGVSPKRFLQYVTAGHARELLEQSSSVLDVSYRVGLSSGSRLHDLFVNVSAATPGEVRSGGEGLTIFWGFHDTPLGRCLIGMTDRGICALSFLSEGGEEASLAELAGMWERAELREDGRRTRSVVSRIFPPRSAPEGTFDLHLKGTNFQLRVWEALLRIPAGGAVTYGDLARSLELPGAARAVGSAIGRNPVAFLIPCHRVILGSGVFGSYRWGEARKKVMLAREASRR
jgi:AraC family transcriptional regulator, regulatory protein of adaptative response / methylated-DNA-[protein]-cysteine methyltransferase